MKKFALFLLLLAPAMSHADWTDIAVCEKGSVRVERAPRTPDVPRDWTQYRLTITNREILLKLVSSGAINTQSMPGPDYFNLDGVEFDNYSHVFWGYARRDQGTLVYRMSFSSAGDIPNAALELSVGWTTYDQLTSFKQDFKPFTKYTFNGCTR